MNAREEEFLADLARALEAEGLEYLLIGGHAVGAYGFARPTRDADFLIPEREYWKWRRFFVALGYEPFNETRNFAQFGAPGGLIGVDLLIVGGETWRKMRPEGKMRMHLGHEWVVAAPEHLIALKLHAIQGNAARSAKDWADIAQLIALGKIEVRAPEFQAMVLRHGGDEAWRRISKGDLLS